MWVCVGLVGDYGVDCCWYLCGKCDCECVIVDYGCVEYECCVV